MKIRSLELQNFQSYDDELITFPDGSTLLSGNMGTGKSTILRGIFCGLFQSDAKRVMPDIDGLDDLVQFGAEEASVELVWDVNGYTYTTEWVLGCDNDGDHSAHTKSCYVEGPGVDVSGVRDVKEVVQDDLIQMDSQSFVNSVYVQQKEIQRLLSADHDDRKKILDGLLGLDVVDDYRDRMKRARPAATRVRDDAGAKEEEIREQLEDFDEEDLRDQQQELNRKISETKSEKGDAEKKIESAVEDLREVNERIDEWQETQDEIEQVERDLESVREDRKENRSSLKSHQDKIEELEDVIIPVDEQDVKDRRERVSDLKADIASDKTRRDGLRDQIDEIDVPDVNDDLIDDLRRWCDALQQQWDAQELQDVKSELSDVTSQIETERRDMKRQVEEMEDRKEKLSGGECPTCGQSVEDHDPDDIDREIETVKNRTQEKIDQLKTRETELRLRKSTLERTQDLLSQFESQLDDLEDQQQERDEKQEKIDELRSELEGIDIEESQHHIGRLDMELDDWETSLEAQRERDKFEEKIDTLESEQERLRQEESGLKKQLEELQEEDWDIGELREARDKIQEAHDDLQDKIRELEDRLEDLRDDLSDVESDLRQIDSLKNRLETAVERKQWAQDRRDETEEMLSAYDSVKSDMRTQNISLLNRYTNEIFRELYRDTNYTEVKIGPDYRIKMLRSTGHTMEPRLASGGEGAVLNLALRAAVYRLVSEKESRVGDLPPFILDEPTQGMDSSHVRQLERLIDTIQGWDVNQIFMVSHEDSLRDITENRMEVSISGGSSSVDVRTS
jgi:exonuclease SbcC